MKTKTFKNSKKLVWILGVASCLTIFETTVSSHFGTRENETQFASTSYSKRNPASRPKSCVMYYERREHPYWANLQKRFKNTKEMILVQTANPSDMVRCVLDHNPDELIILSPTMQVKSQRHLALSLPLSDAEAAKNYQADVKAMKVAHEKIMHKKSFGKCVKGKSHVYPCNGDQQKELQLRHEIERLAKLKPQDPAYQLAYGYRRGIILSKAFDDLYALAKTSNLKLKNIRVMTSNPRQLAKAYPVLRNLAREQRIKIRPVPAHFLRTADFSRQMAMVQPPM